jgi:hypothetical protein
MLRQVAGRTRCHIILYIFSIPVVPIVYIPVIGKRPKWRPKISKNRIANQKYGMLKVTKVETVITLSVRE